MAFEPPPMQASSEVRQPAFGLLHLRARLVADHALKIAHHHRIGMRTGHGADAVERVGDIGDPVAQCFVHRVFERLRAGFDRPHLGAQRPHAQHVGLLSRQRRSRP